MLAIAVSKLSSGLVNSGAVFSFSDYTIRPKLSGINSRPIAKFRKSNSEIIFRVNLTLIRFDKYHIFQNSIN